MIFFKTNLSGICVPNGSPPLTTYLRHGISRLSKPSFKMNKTMEADCNNMQKRYVHANNHYNESFYR